MKSREYELLVREIYQQILDQEEAQNIVVEHDVRQQGISTSHQIDVHWEFLRGGLAHRVAVQVKQWKRPISKGAVLTFKGVLDDLPGTIGVMVTANGYQQGALEVAGKYGITICELRESADPHITIRVGTTVKLTSKGVLKTAGKPYAFAMTLDFTTPEFSDWRVQFDKDWLNARGMSESLISPIHTDFQDIELYDGDGKLSCTLMKIYNDMGIEVCKEFNETGVVGDRKTHVFEESTFLKASSLPEPIKVNSLSAKVIVNKSSKEVEMPLKNVALFILKNLTDGAVRRFAQIP